MGYCRAGTASIHPLDETLQLPARSFSYELQKRMVKAAVQGTFRETGERIAEITGAPVPVRSIEEVLQQAAEDFDAFYVEPTPPTSTGTGSLQVAADDSQGSPMLNTHGRQRAGRLTQD